MKTEKFLLRIFACSAVLYLAACSDEYMPSDAEKMESPVTIDGLSFSLITCDENMIPKNEFKEGEYVWFKFSMENNTDKVFGIEEGTLHDPVSIEYNNGSTHLINIYDVNGNYVTLVQTRPFVNMNVVDHATAYPGECCPDDRFGVTGLNINCWPPEGADPITVSGPEDVTYDGGYSWDRNLPAAKKGKYIAKINSLIRIDTCDAITSRFDKFGYVNIAMEASFEVK